MVVAWCELRQALRHFRLDRIREWHALPARFEGQGEALIAQWETTQKDAAVTTQTL